MTGVEVAQKVVAEKQAHLVRALLEQREGEPLQYMAKPWGTGKGRGWVLLDLFTAGAITRVAAALNPENQERFARLPLQRQATVALRLLDGARA